MWNNIAILFPRLGEKHLSTNLRGLFGSKIAQITGCCQNAKHSLRCKCAKKYIGTLEYWVVSSCCVGFSKSFSAKSKLEKLLEFNLKFASKGGYSFVNFDLILCKSNFCFSWITSKRFLFIEFVIEVEVSHIELVTFDRFQKIDFVQRPLFQLLSVLMPKLTLLLP